MWHGNDNGEEGNGGGGGGDPNNEVESDGDAAGVGKEEEEVCTGRVRGDGAATAAEACHERVGSVEEGHRKQTCLGLVSLPQCQRRRTRVELRKVLLHLRGDLKQYCLDVQSLDYRVCV